MTIHGAGSRTRTYEAERREIYSLLWLPLHDSSMKSITYQRNFVDTSWSRFTDSNRRPAVYKTAALTNWAKAAHSRLWTLCRQSNQLVREHLSYSTVVSDSSWAKRHLSHFTRGWDISQDMTIIYCVFASSDRPRRSWGAPIQPRLRP